jgi:hypothetical protein
MWSGQNDFQLPFLKDTIYYDPKTAKEAVYLWLPVLEVRFEEELPGGWMGDSPRHPYGRVRWHT